MNANALYTADNLPVLKSMAKESIDLVYLDPPFNSNRNYKAKAGSDAEGAGFGDRWNGGVDPTLMARLAETHPRLVDYICAVKHVHSESMAAYLVFLSPRLLELRRVLKPTGSIYLHCDPTSSHFIKGVMDYIFGKENYRNDIAWCYPPQAAGPAYGFHRKHDSILFYGKTEVGVFHRPFTPMTDVTKKGFRHIDEDGRRYKTYPRGRSYLDEREGRPVPSWWTDIHSLGQTVSSGEITGYPTQKPLALLRRIIRASSNEGDVVLDPFCGCGTTLVAAQQLDRKWIGIDKSTDTPPLIKKRLANKVGALLSDFTHHTDAGAAL